VKSFSRIFAILIFLAFAHPAHAKKIYVAISNPDMSFLSGGVAQYEGYFREEGLDVEVVQIAANVSIAALAAGNIDYNLILQSIVTGNLRGLPMKVAAILIERPNHVFVVDKSIQRFTDLKGKKIAISSYGSLTDILARLTAAHYGLDPKADVGFTAAGTSNGRLAQLQSGVVQAALVTPPGDVIAEKMGFKRLLEVGTLFPFPVNGVGLHEQKLKNERDEVKRVLRALYRANQFILDNPKGAIKDLAAWGRTSVAAAEDAYKGTGKNYSRNLVVSRATLEQVLESTRWNIETKKNVAVEDVFDFGIMREILKEMGKKAD
jgi:ABC-type nitrate/sulfonate/bicarbonate transport system substrate-binding protein